MKKKFKRTAAILMALMMVTTTVFATVSTVSAAEVTENGVGASSGTTGDCTWTLDDEGKLTISGNGAMGDYDHLNPTPWGTKVKEVEINSGVARIGDWAFADCAELMYVIIPDSVTEIGYGAFRFCSGLSSAEIPNNVTSIGDYAFGESGLLNVKIPDSVTIIGEGAFWYCSELANVDLGYGVTNIGDGAFYYCEKLTSIVVPASVSSIGEEAFECCSEDFIIRGESNSESQAYAQANKIDFSAKVDNGTTGDCTWVRYDDGLLTINGNGAMEDFNNRNPAPWGKNVKKAVINYGLTNIGNNAFADSVELTSIIIPESVINIGKNAFSRCNGLTKVSIPNGVTTIGESAFLMCSELEKVAIGDDVTNIGNRAFEYCTKVKSVTLGKSVKIIGANAFDNCQALNNISIPKSVTDIGSYAFQNTKISFLILPSHLKTIGEYAFRACSLDHVQIPSSVTSIGVKALGYTGSNNKVERFFIIGKAESEAQRYAEENGLSFFDRPYDGTTGDCTWSLDDEGTLTISGNGATDNYDYSHRAPWGSGIEKVVINSGVTRIGDWAFALCDDLNSVMIPDSVTEIGYGAFQSCLELSSVEIPNSVTNIGDYAFSHSGLLNVEIPDSVTGIGEGAFYDSKLTNVTLGNGLTSIGNYAFADCENLTSITIPASVTYIGEEAFDGIDNFYIIGNSNSEAQRYAEENDIEFVDLADCGEDGSFIENYDDASPVASVEGEEDNGQANTKQLNLVKGSSCFNVVWNKVPNASKYRLYFGVNCKWRRYTDLNLNEISVYPKNNKSVQFLINSKSLTTRHWEPFGEEKNIATRSITTTNNYCCQVEALDKNNNHIFWTNVGYVYLGAATTSTWSNKSDVGVSWNHCKGCNWYKLAYKYEGQKGYTYKSISGSQKSYSFTIRNAKKATKYYFQVIPCIMVKNEICAYGYWSKTKSAIINYSFKWGQDNWSFDNSGQYFSNYNVNSTVFNLMKQDFGLSNSQAYELNQAIKDDNYYGFGGSCFGMTVSEIMAKQGDLRLSRYGGNDVVNKNSNTSNMTSVINFIQELQSVSQFSQIIRETPFTSNNYTQYDYINKAESVLKNKNIFVKISYGIQRLNKNTGQYSSAGYHAVLGYGIENCNYYSSVTGKSYDRKILVADPNFLSKNGLYGDSCIYYKSSDHSWICPYWNSNSTFCYWNSSSGSSTNTGKIRNIMKYNSLTDTVDLMSDYSVDHYISGLTVDNISGNPTMVEQIKNTGNPNLDYAENAGSGIAQYNIEMDDSFNVNDSEEFYALWNPTANYSVSYSKPSSYKLKMDYENVMYYANIENGTYTLFKPSGTINIRGTESTYKVTMVTDDTECVTDWYALGVAGNGASNLTFNKHNNGYLLSSNNLKNITVSAKNNTVDISKTFSTTYDSVFIYEINENTIGLKVDTDGNGTYETELSDNSVVYKMGDVNSDGVVSVFDVTEIQKYAARICDFTELQLMVSDVNRDGHVDILDATLLQRYVAGFDVNIG